MTMREKIARAIHAAHGYEDDWTYYADAATAALQAMREPSVHMLSEGSLRGACPERVDGYAAMIDAAIAEVE